MSVSCPEAISVLASLNRKANSTDAVYNAPSISSMLNGLRNMDDNITEVRRTLRMITRRLRKKRQTRGLGLRYGPMQHRLLGSGSFFLIIVTHGNRNFSLKNCITSQMI